jgi:hypothetical protein
MSVLEKIQLLVVNRDVDYRYHSTEEKLREINMLRGLSLTTKDIDSAIFTGEIVDILDNDKRGRRYVICGVALDENTVLEIVCRIENNVVIKVYEPYF